MSESSLSEMSDELLSPSSKMPLDVMLDDFDPLKSRSSTSSKKPANESFCS